MSINVMVLSHEVLSQKEARVESLSYFFINLVGVIHEFLKFLWESNHSLSEGGEKFFD